jgi:Flp pilus assembly pilin Flp
MLVPLLQAGAIRLTSRLRREEGQALIEYVLIGALISVACIILLTWVGFDVNSVLDKIDNALGGSGNPPAAPAANNPAP